MDAAVALRFGRLLRYAGRIVRAMFARDPRDRRYPERMTASYVVSILLHALVALLLFSVASSSSQEGASQSTAGGEVITVSQQSATRAMAIPAASAAPPAPHAPVIAPQLRHAAISQPSAQRPPQQRHELSKNVPNASPNPPPVPQASAQPNPQPTQPIIEPTPDVEIPAVPASVPSAAAIAVATKVPLTAAPSAASSAAPTRLPKAKAAPSAAPTKSPATPAPAVASNAPPKPQPVARATVAPQQASPGPQASQAPAKVAGVPSPSPTTGSPQAKSQGVALSPGPRGLQSPGPRNGAGVAKPGPVRPVSVSATPRPSPRPGGSGSRKQSLSARINAKLQGLIPTGPANPTQKRYTSGPDSLVGKLQPTPPPEIVARTKYIYQSSGTGGEARTKMWVTEVHRHGFFTTCSGWLVRWPEPPSDSLASGANGTQISIGGGHAHGVLSTGAAGQDPIVEPNATYVCSERALTPFTPP